MGRLETMERYLSAHTADKDEPGRDSGARVRPFITISRQAGAGGHNLADALIEVFNRQPETDLFGGWQVFDRKLCEMVADNPTYSRSMDSLVAEEYRSKANEFFHQILTPTIDQDLVMHQVFRVVAAVASIGKCIIIGRAASEVTRDMGPRISIRLVAPEDVRIRGMMEYYGLDDRAARDEARRIDVARARLLKTHFQADIEDPVRYDVIWNTGQVSSRTIAESIAATVRSQVGVADSGVRQ